MRVPMRTRANEYPFQSICRPPVQMIASDVQRSYLSSKLPSQKSRRKLHSLSTRAFRSNRKNSSFDSSLPPYSASSTTLTLGARRVRAHRIVTPTWMIPSSPTLRTWPRSGARLRPWRRTARSGRWPCATGSDYSASRPGVPSTALSGTM